MGQYHIVVNLSRKEILHPYKFGDGLKLLEFGCSANGTMTALAVLLADSNGRGGGDLRSADPIIGSWAGDRIVITGDYGDEGKWLSQSDIQQCADGRAGDKPPNLYCYAGEYYRDISAEVLNALCDDAYILGTVKESYERGIIYDSPLVEAVRSLPALLQKVDPQLAAAEAKFQSNSAAQAQLPAADSAEALDAFDLES